MAHIDTDNNEVETENFPDYWLLGSELPPSRRFQYMQSLGHASMATMMWFSGITEAGAICSNETYAGDQVSPAAEPYVVTTYNIGQGEYGLDGVLDIVMDQPPANTTCLQEALEHDVSKLKTATGQKNGSVNLNGRAALFGRYGNVTLTTDRILYSKVYDLPSHPDHPQRTLLATIQEDENGVRRVIFNAHLAAQNGNLEEYGVTERMAQLLTILWDIRWEPQYRGLPLILCVDLNEGPDGLAYAAATEHLNDTTRDIGERLITLPEYWTQVDFVFADGLLAEQATVFGDRGPNHCGVLVFLVEEPAHQPYSSHVIYPGPR